MSSEREAGPFRRLGPMPREGWLPKSEPTLKQRQGLPQGLEIWVWDSYSRAYDKTMPMGVAFIGKASKPAWYHSFKTEAAREALISETVKSHESRLQSKLQRQEERKQFTHGLVMDDILVASWGYDQTNINFYQVVGVPTPKTVLVREVGSKIIKSDGFGSDYVMPTPNHFVDTKIMKRIPSGGRNWNLSVKISDSISAHKWDGKPARETSFGWGH